MIRLFYGEDSFRLKKKLEEIQRENKDAELTVFEDADPKEIFMSFLTQSFFGGKRIIIVKNVSKIIKENETELLETLNKAPKDLEIILCDTEPIGPERGKKKAPVPGILKSKTYKFVKDNGEVIGFESLKGSGLINFIKEKVREEGADIAPLATEKLASFTTGDLWQIEEEIKKLALYKKTENQEEAEPIQSSDVDLLVKANFEANIFNLLDAIATKNQRKAVQLLNDFLESGENEIYILSMIARGFRNIAMAKFERTTESSLAKRAGIHPFVAKKTVYQAKNFEKAEVINMYGKLVWADLKLKSGSEPKQILLRLIV